MFAREAECERLSAVHLLSQGLAWIWTQLVILMYVVIETNNVIAMPSLYLLHYIAVFHPII